jgi:hypothetical protein
MIPKKLEDYVKIYHNFIDDETCDSLVSILNDPDKVNWNQHSFYNAVTKEYISYEKELSVSYVSCEESLNIQNKIWFGIEQYVLKDFQVCHQYYNSWSGYSQLKFNRYDVNTRMKLHCDHIQSMFDGQVKGIPTLTVLGALNDDYEGGELIMWEDTLVHLPKGSLMIFPSNFLYPHRVEDVKKGIRYSFASWVW